MSISGQIKLSFLYLLSATCLILILSACGNSGNGEGTVRGTFDFTGEIWAERDTLSFTLPEGSEHMLGNTGSFATNGEVFYFWDRTDGQFLAFERSGEFMGALGGSGRGPGEYSPMVEIYVDMASRLFIADNRLLRLNIFGPDLQFQQTVGLEYRINDLAVHGERVYTFSHFAPKKFAMYDLQGNLLKEFLEPADTAQSIFLVTRRTGGMDWDPGSERLYGLYPEAFRIHEMDNQLDTLRVLEAADGHDLRPAIPDFPDNLDPYGSTDAHWEYWNSFNHIGGLHYTGNGVLVVSYTRLIDFENSEYERYLNAYKMDGTVLFEGMALPAEGRIIASVGDRFYFNISDPESATATVMVARLRSF